jgi:hypothetical protein
MNITWKGNVLSMEWCLSCHNEPEKFLRDHAPGKHLSPQEQVFEFYRELQLQDHVEGSKYALMKGNGQLQTKEEIEAGAALLTKYRVNKKQLSDCWVCHR